MDLFSVALDGMASQHYGRPPNTDKLLAYLLVDRLDVDQAFDWAIGALEAGFDNEALRVLASLSLSYEPSIYEARPYLSAALRELQITEEQPKEAVLRAYGHRIAIELAAGLIPAALALNEMHSVVVSPLDHPPDLMGWCYLWEGNHADGSFAEMSDQEAEQEARAFAATWLANFSRKPI